MIVIPFLNRIALPALLLAVGACATSRQSAVMHSESDLSCTDSQSRVRDRLEALNTLDGRGHSQRLTAYRAAVEHMLVACDAEARSMSATLADDWKIQSVFVRRDLARFEGASPGAIVDSLPSHRRRIDRLIATYAAMYGNPPRTR